jgi:sugar lactone lactonase YvrE
VIFVAFVVAFSLTIAAMRRVAAAAVTVVLLAPLGAQDYPPPFPRTNAEQVLETPRFTVWRVVWPKGQPTAMHRHPHDQVGTYYAPGKRAITQPDGSRREADTAFGAQSNTRAGTLHIEEGISDVPLRAVFIELTNVAHDDVSMLDYTWPIGAAETRVEAADAVYIWMGGGTIRQSVDGGAPEVFTAAPGAVQFRARGSRHTDEALSGTPRAFVYSLAEPGDPNNNLPQPYQTRRDWGELPPGVSWAAVTAVEPAPDGSIYVVHRCHDNSCAGRAEDPILKYDANGHLVKSWGSGMFLFPHGATVDRDGNLWVTDARGNGTIGHQVFEFSPDGRVLMTLGQAGVSGSGPALFDQPTDVVVSPEGDVFVTDSHRNGKNNRVVKFTRDGRFVKEWGVKGSGPGQLSEPHSIAMDARGRLFVADRENNRIEIFDQDGVYLDEWRQFGRPSGIFITPDDTIYVADSESGPDTGAHELSGIRKGIRIGSVRDGSVRAFIEDAESTRPDHSGAEGVGVDANGNVYGAVVRRQMLEVHTRGS